MPDKTVPYVPAHKSIPTVESSLQSIDEIFNDLQCGLKSAKESKCFICHLDVNKDEEKLQVKSKVLGADFRHFIKNA